MYVFVIITIIVNFCLQVMKGSVLRIHYVDTVSSLDMAINIYIYIYTLILNVLVKRGGQCAGATDYAHD